MRVADYLISYIYDDLNCGNIFMISGGGIMHIMDAISTHGKIKYTCSHNEQATTMQADAYAKIKIRKLGVAVLTSGPGATNAITGIVGAWQDSSPVLAISGQSKLSQTIHNSNLKLRQFGVQEVDIIPIVKSVTKYAVTVDKPKEIRYHLEKAAFLALEGRPGPVWLDIPLDIQGAKINPDELTGFDPKKEGYIKESSQNLEEDTKYILAQMQKIKRPIFIAGYGVRASDAVEDFKKLVKKLNIPIVTPRIGIDLIDSIDNLYIGRPGIKGDRAANFAVQNADLIITIGSKLSINLTGHEYDKFAREAHLIVVDIDEIEHKKHTIKIDKFIKSDAKEFINLLLQNAENLDFPDFSKWCKKCLEWKIKYPVVLPDYKCQKPINTYYFVDELSKKLSKDDVIIIDSGSSSYVVSQAIKIKSGQRYLASGGLGSMGYAVPAAVGASIASGKKRVVAITGDGSFHMNLQELQTIVHEKLPVKMVIFNNNGYSSIKTTQKNFFEGRFVGVDRNSGVSLPDFKKAAKLYGIKYLKLDNPTKVTSVIEKMLKSDAPVILDLFCSADQPIIPTVFSVKKNDGEMVSMPLEDMFPFLSREEFFENMIVKLTEESLKLKL